MIQNAFTGEPKAKAKTLAEQKSDFTAEGAPPANPDVQTHPTTPAAPTGPAALPDAGRGAAKNSGG